MQQNVNNTIITSDRNTIISTISIKTFLKLQNDGYNISKKRVLEFVKESCNECSLQNGKIVAILSGNGKDIYENIIKEVNHYGTMDSGSYTEWDRLNPLMILSIFMIARNHIITSNKFITRELLQDAIKKGYNDLMIDCRARTYHKSSMLRAIEMTSGMKELLDPKLITELSNDNNENNQMQIEYPVQNPNVYRVQNAQQNVQGNRINAIEFIDNDEEDEVEEISRKKRKYN